MRNIWLIRHAQSLANQEQIIQGQGVLDTELTPLGLQQALATANYFYEQNWPIETIYASDLKRAKQTAQAIADKFNLKVQTDTDLREAHFGRWEGCYFANLASEDSENYHKWLQDKTWRPAFCESFTALQTRANLVLNKILAKTSQNIIIVSHGGLIAALLASLSDKFGKHPSSHNCGVSHLKITENKIEVVKVDFLIPQMPTLPENSQLGSIK